MSGEGGECTQEPPCGVAAPADAEQVHPSLLVMAQVHREAQLEMVHVWRAFVLALGLAAEVNNTLNQTIRNFQRAAAGGNARGTWQADFHAWWLEQRL